MMFEGFEMFEMFEGFEGFNGYVVISCKISFAPDKNRDRLFGFSRRTEYRQKRMALATIFWAKAPGHS
jgi:hypothetical protein